MPQPTSNDHEKFQKLMDQVVADDEGHVYLPEMWNGSQTFRSYIMYWWWKYGSAPGQLRKSCTEENCVVHYEERGHVLTKDEVQEIKDAPDYWGLTTDLAKKYGVSKARISQIRKSR